MPIKNIAISKLVTNAGQIPGLPKNPRFIKDDRFGKLKKSIEDDPEMLSLREVIAVPSPTDPDRFVVICGNMRLRACKDLGHKVIPCKVLPAGTPPEKLRAYAIKDNVGFGADDWELMANEWDAVELEDWGVEIPGFDEEEVLEVKEDNYTIPDKIKTDIVIGDLFEIGQHRLLCGDSTSSDDVDKLMGGEKADLMVTDPPYGVKYVGKTKEALTIENDALSENETHDLWRSAFSNFLLFAKDGASVYATVPAGLLQLGFMQVMNESECLRQCMVWDKGQMVLGHSDYHYRHEPILYGWKPGAAHYFTKDRTKTTVFEYAKPVRNAEHHTMKPLELWAEFIENSSLIGSIVIDLFLGSGTTMVTAHQLNRKCYGLELSPEYCQVIIDRMLKLDPTLTIKRNGIDVTDKYNCNQIASDEG